MAEVKFRKGGGGGGGGGEMDPIGFSDYKFEVFMQSQWNFHYLWYDNKRIIWC